MTKKTYIRPMTETVLPLVDALQHETVDVHFSEENPGGIEANDSFFDEEDDEDNANFWVD